MSKSLEGVSANRAVDSDSTAHRLPRIDLREILNQLCHELMESGGFHLVEIYQWDQSSDEAISLADAAHAAYIEHEGERFRLDELPTTAKVLASGNIATIDADMQLPESEWMEEYGLKTLLIAPLYRQEEIIGLAELASADRTLLSNRATLAKCEAIIQQASAWLKHPLKDSPRKKLFQLAEDFKTSK